MLLLPKPEICDIGVGSGGMQPETDLGGWKHGNPPHTGAKPLACRSPVIIWEGDHVPSEPIVPGDTMGK